MAMATRKKKEVEMQGVYMDLMKHAENGDYDKALKIANRLLQDNPKDEIAFRTKIGCMLCKNQIQEALPLMKDNPKLCGKLQYELAYCYYRVQEMEASKALLGVWNDSSLRKLGLMYHLANRQDDLPEVYELLQEVMKNPDFDMDNERQANMTEIKETMKLMKAESCCDQKTQTVTSGNSYETRCSTATGMLGEDKIIESEALLLKVKKQVSDVLQDDGAVEAVADEIGLIKDQRASCAKVLERPKPKEAMALKAKPTDAAVASNSMRCNNKDQNVLDSKKRMKRMTAEGKLNDLQRRDILFNKCIFHLYTMNDKACIKCCKEVEKDYPEFAEDVLMIKAVVVSRTGGEDNSKKGLHALLKNHPDLAVKICLGLVQMALKDDDIEEAISMLQDLGTNYYRPGVIKALVTLFKSLGMNVEAGKVLKDAVQYYRKNNDPKNKENMAALWRQTAHFMIAQGDFEEASRSLEELRKIAPNDTVSLDQLIVAYSQSDMAEAKKLSQTPMRLLVQPDVEIAMESPNVKKTKKGKKQESVPPSSAKPVVPSTSDEKEGSKSTKKKISSKNKVPCTFETERKPDLERYLPEFERSTYRPDRPKKRLRKGSVGVDVGKGTEGAGTSASAAYAMSGKLGQQKEETTPVQAACCSKDTHKKKKK